MVSKNGDNGTKKENYQKIKLLKLYSYISRHSDDHHPLTTKELLEYLRNEGIPCDRRTLAKDISVLNEYGYEVLIRCGRQKSYYVPEYNRAFEEAELRTLIDAVQAARFINPEKTGDLVTRLANLVSEPRSKLLRDGAVFFYTNKSPVKNIFSYIDIAAKAIRTQCKLSFRYFDLDEQRQKVFRNGGKPDTVNPLALVYREDAYYLVCFSVERGHPCYYRIDRMDGVKRSRENIDEECRMWLNQHSIEDFVRQSVRMYAGDQDDIVTLMYKAGDYRMLGAIYDKFAQNMRFLPDNPNYPNWKFVEIQVRTSPTFWGWLVQYMGGIEVFENKYRCQLKQFLLVNLGHIENNPEQIANSNHAGI